MRRNKRFTFWQWFLLCLLVGLGSPSLQITEARTSQKVEEKIPGLPPGYTLIEGDIQVPVEFARSLRRQSPNAPQATLGASFWPNGIVPFEFDNSACTPKTSTCVEAANQTAMLNAMAEIEAIANVDFQNCPDNKCSGDYVHVQASTGNNSAIGKTGGQQVINIASWSDRFRIVHELLHCLGMYHEQSRRDRDNFVTINCGNIQGDSGDCQSSLAKINFNRLDNVATYRDYDFDSVMHYDRCAFSKDCPAGLTCNCTNETITVKASNNKIGQRDHMSTLDKLAMMGIY
ncbi:MAG: M12 family metallopeptidase, partial [Blastocatellia bacterium]